MMAASGLFQEVTHFHRGKKESREEVRVDSVGGKVLGIYFSASWCPPCRAFTPKLAEWYNKLVTSGRLQGKLEIIFVSSDRDDESFDQYYDTMPWLALPFAEKTCKMSLSNKFQVNGIPTLVLVDNETGDVITKGGRAIVSEDPDGLRFPWKYMS